MSVQRTILIYGGTFDPPHLAHVQLPDLVRTEVEADEVIYLPAGIPPHKQDLKITPAHHRIAMLELALLECPWAVIDARETREDRPQPSYTVTTLEQLRSETRPSDRIRLLIGSDQAALFETWRDPERIEEIAEPLVMIRPPLTPESFLVSLPEDQRSRWRPRLVTIPPRDVSSTQIREAVRNGQEPDHLDPRVLAYIRENGLYLD